MTGNCLYKSLAQGLCFRQGGSISGAANAPACLFLHQRSIKNRPGIKVSVVGPPKTPAIFIFLPDWQLNEQLNSAFLVFDLIAGNASLKIKGDTRNFIYTKRDHRKQAV